MKKSYFFDKKQLVLFCLIIVILISTIFGFVLFLYFESDNDEKTLFKNSINSVVEIKAETEDVGESFGTAVFIDNDGTLITNAHVVVYKSGGIQTEFEKIYIRFADEVEYRQVQLQKFDMSKDLAVLKLIDTNCEFKAITFFDSSKIQAGDTVYGVGNLNNSGISLTKGIVSNSSVNVKYDEIERQVIQCDLTIAEGNSGGALLNKNGELVGLTTFRLKDNSGNVIYGIAYCIPANTILEYKKINKGD